MDILLSDFLFTLSLHGPELSLQTSFIGHMEKDLEIQESDSFGECIDETLYEDEEITEVVGTFSEMSDDYPTLLSEDENFGGSLSPLIENRYIDNFIDFIVDTYIHA